MANETNNETVTWDSAQQDVLDAISAAAKSVQGYSNKGSAAEHIKHLAEALAWVRSTGQPH